MANIHIYYIAVLVLLLTLRILSEKLFYKLSDADKLKTLELSRKARRVSYWFYGVVMAGYLASVFIFSIGLSVPTKVLAISIALYNIIFSFRLHKIVRSANIVIPYYGSLLFARAIVMTAFCSLLFFYANQFDEGKYSMAVYDEMEKARERWEKGDNRSAVEIYNRLIEEDSTVSIYYINRGVYRSNIGDSVGAYKDWNRALNMGDTMALRYIR